MKKQRLSGPLLTRASDTASIAVIDEESRVIELSFSSEFPVTRASWFDEPWIETLGHTEREMDLSRLNGGAAPVLYDHNRFERRTHVGTVEKAWIDSKRGKARLRLSKRSDVDDLWQDIKDGIVRCVSAGYKILERTLTKKNEKAPSEYRVTRWMPYEISFTPIPADPTVGVGRSDDTDDLSQRFIITDIDEVTTMPERNEISAEAESNATERAATIMELATRHGFNDDAIQWVRSSMSLEQVRAAMLDKLADRSDGISHAPYVGESGFASESDFQRAAAEGILLRAGLPVTTQHPAARDMRQLSMRELARSCLSRQGIRHSSLSDVQLIERALTTSDFPAILTTSVNASLRVGFENEPASHRAWVRRQPVVDFNEQVRPAIGSVEGLLPVNEGGEYENSPISEEGSAKYRVSKYGRIVTLTLELIVNDRLGAWLRLLPALGQAARRSEADAVYALFALNTGNGPTMAYDSQPLFHASHNNITVAGAFNLGTLGAARALMRKQTVPGGGYASIVPKYMIVSADDETEAEALLAPLTRHRTTVTASNVTTGIEGTPTPEWVRNLELVVEPRLPNTAFYLAADSMQIDTVELGVLEENIEGPTIDTFNDSDSGGRGSLRASFRRDLFEWKARHVHGAAAIDHRGLVKVPLSS